LTAVFLDPPYSVGNVQYSSETGSITEEVNKWCLENTEDEKMRIALCGYEGEHNNLEELGWEKFCWKANGGYSNQSSGKSNSNLERIWFSPSCLKPEEGS
jgi:DNA adenine methylase